LAPDGLLEVLDVQKEMLDELMERAARAGIENIVATRATDRGFRIPTAVSTPPI